MGRRKSTWQLLTIDDIAEYRKRKGFRSDVALAKDLEVSVGSISGWKKGVRAPSLRVQQQLVEKIRGGHRPSRAARVDARKVDDLVARLLALAPEVKDPAPLIEAAKHLLQSHAEAGAP